MEVKTRHLARESTQRIEKATDIIRTANEKDDAERTEQKSKQVAPAVARAQDVRQYEARLGTKLNVKA